MYRRRNERYPDCCVLERDRFGGGDSVKVWTAIAHGFRSPLVNIDGNLNAERYLDDVLTQHVIQHDNTTSRTARDTVNFLRTNTVDFIDDWPANSPNLNPIEHVWIVWTDD